MSAIEQWHEVMKVGGKEGASKLIIFYMMMSYFILQ